MNNPYPYPSANANADEASAALLQEPARSIIDSLLSRRSVKELVEPAPSEAEVELIIDAALCAPDHGRLQPWRFVVIRGEARHALGNLFVEAARRRNPAERPDKLERARSKATRAPLQIALGAAIRPQNKIPEIEQMLSVGAAAMNILNATHALGYAAFWTSGAAIQDAHVVAALGLGADTRLLGFIQIGMPAEAPQSLPRPSRDEYVSYWHGTSVADAVA